MQQSVFDSFISFPPSISFSSFYGHTLTHIFTHSHIDSVTHTHTHIHSLTLCTVSHTNIRTLPMSHTNVRTHTHTLTLSYTHSHTHKLSLPLQDTSNALIFKIFFVPREAAFIFFLSFSISPPTRRSMAYNEMSIWRETNLSSIFFGQQHYK